ncbi:MAG TPA: class I tRNA ligase family protein, partial [Thermoplasmata archaeon]|nr:class I tRNA ligase family protein [Thermoplasmata archaeon]
MSGATPLAPRFVPSEIEGKWQAAWESDHRFRAPPVPSGKTFVVPLPPPNVTGILTMGHMLGGTVQDLLARWHRMRGFAVLWVPGLDHAGLATQVEVRRRLESQGIDVASLPPERLRDRIEQWKREHEARILAQARA